MKPCVPALLVVLAGAVPAGAQTWQPPTPQQRCPSKWGAADERGAANHVTPEAVARAARLIRTGQIVELGRVLASDMPFFVTRRFDLYTKRTNGPLGTNKRNSNEELVVTELGQVGTQFDMFSHQGIDGQFYNCVPIDSVATRTGFSKMGVEKIGTLFARGVLIDVAAFKGVEMLSAGYEITAADLEGALAQAGGDARPRRCRARSHRLGPAVGSGQRALPRQPRRASAWAARPGWPARDVLLIGTDTSSIELSPNPDKSDRHAGAPDRARRQRHLPAREPEARRPRQRAVHEFAFIVQPLKIRGGTGSTVAPIAVR